MTLFFSVHLPPQPNLTNLLVVRRLVLRLLDLFIFLLMYRYHMTICTPLDETLNANLKKLSPTESNLVVRAGSKVSC